MTPAAVIGGSGPSLLTCDLSRIPSHARVYRTNNFFLEKKYHLGRRVDCLYFSGDRRALRFYVATVRSAIKLDMYQFHDITTHQIGSYNFGHNAPKTTFFDPAQCNVSFGFSSRVKPTTGVLAALKAVQDGARRLYFAGLDFYEGDVKYAISPGPILTRVNKPNAALAGYDKKLHDLDVDMRVLRAIEDAGVEIFTTSEQVPSPFPLAPRCSSPLDPGEPEKTHQLEDWVAWDGPIPIQTLFFLRALRRRAASLY